MKCRNCISFQTSFKMSLERPLWNSPWVTAQQRFDCSFVFLRKTNATFCDFIVLFYVSKELNVSAQFLIRDTLLKQCRIYSKTLKFILCKNVNNDIRIQTQFNSTMKYLPVKNGISKLKLGGPQTFLFSSMIQESSTNYNMGIMIQNFTQFIYIFGYI